MISSRFRRVASISAPTGVWSEMPVRPLIVSTPPIIA
jgi:hypothetical protein